MFEGMRVLSNGNVAVGLFCAAVLGGAAVIFVQEQFANPAPPPAVRPRPPMVVHRTDTETVAEIPTQLDGRAVTCTLRINYRTRYWSLSC